MHSKNTSSCKTKFRNVLNWIRAGFTASVFDYGTRHTTRSHSRSPAVSIADVWIICRVRVCGFYARTRPLQPRDWLKRRSGAVDPVFQRRVSNVTALSVLTGLCRVKREIIVTYTEFFGTNRISIKVLRNSVFDLIDSERSDGYGRGRI